MNKIIKIKIGLEGWIKILLCSISFATFHLISMHFAK